MYARTLQVDDYFLSATNPLANADQRDCERKAIALMQTHAFAKLRAATERRWRELAGNEPTAEAWERFPSLMDECAFAALMKAVNGDPSRPRVTRIVMPPHEWFDMSVPGSRFAGGPGADQSYAIIPVDYGTRYCIQGRWLGDAPADHNYTLSGNGHFMNSLGTLQHDQIQVRKDGTFTLTVGPEPGGQNHLQTAPGTEYLFIRDCRSDWRQAATALTVEALDPPRTPPWTDEQILGRALQLALDDAPPMFYWVRLYQGLQPNVPVGPSLTDDIGGLVSQTTSLARIVLADDEALVITLDPAGAAFHDVQLNDYWFGSVGDYFGRTASFNNAQTQLSADGTATYVVSITDPGIHNWLDPNGLHETLFVARWQRLPRTASRRPAIKMRLVNLNKLDSLLPKDIERVDEQARRAQIEERLSTYRLRLAH
jgi:hypothetical protein